jgi:hypothetical protein
VQAHGRIGFFQIACHPERSASQAYREQRVYGAESKDLGGA